ncbi:MAG: hypothetical protein WA984_04160 [Phormidesmis sp.]
MVKASGQIEKELGLLQQRTEDMAEALDTLYGGYLKALGEASKQQLMSAVHHLCTQAYPDKFLALSWQQRNQLQKSLQVMATQISIQLIEQRSQVKKTSRKPSKNNGIAFLQQLLAAKASGAIIHTQSGSSDDLLDKLSEIARFETSSTRSDDSGGIVHDPLTDVEVADSEKVNPTDSSRLNDTELNNSEDDYSEDDYSEDDYSKAGLDALSFEEIGEESTESRQASDLAPAEHEGYDGIDFDADVPTAEQRLTLSEEEDLLGALEALSRRSESDHKDDSSSEEPLLAPKHLLKQQMLMEKAIRDVFQTVSEAANELLQKANVMPNFPKALMAAASDTRGLGEPLNAVPNVVKVSVRVMQGEPSFDTDDNDDPTYREDEDTYKRRQRKLGRRGQARQSGRRDKDRSNQRRDAAGERRSDRESDNGSDRGNSRENERSSRRFMPIEAIEIDAFPELAVISLQLSEVEFADPRVSVWRSRLRKELAHLKQLGIRYKKTERSLETAQAEDAWRASWTAVEES